MLVEVSGLQKIYGTAYGATSVALRGVSFGLTAGAFVAVMGPSGSGKSTLLHLIAGLIEPTAGRVVIEGQVIHELPEDERAALRRRRLGLVFQEPHLLDGLTVEENVLLALAIERPVGPAERERVADMLQQLGILDLAKRFPAELSGGQQQRVAIARALVHRPALVLADEPTGNLDSFSSARVLEAFVELQQRQGAAVLLVTHDPLVASYAERVLVLADGQLYSEIWRNREGREQFYQRIVSSLAALEGVYR
jgi:ABC-type lipoprotein export system ATPase subunit